MIQQFLRRSTTTSRLTGSSVSTIRRQLHHSKPSNFARFQQFRLFSSSENKDDQKPDPEPKPQPTNEDSQQTAASETVTENPLETEIKKLKEEVASTKDHLLRTLAESENVRKRSMKEIETARKFAIQSFAKQMLEVADNLHRAIESVPKEEVEKENADPHLVSLFQGVEMTLKGLDKVFVANHVIQFGAVGEKFDPHLHNAMFNVEDETKEKGSISQVIKTGYKFHDRVIRPADVGTIQ